MTRRLQDRGAPLAAGRGGEVVTPQRLTGARLVDVQRVDASPGELVAEPAPDEHLLGAVEPVDVDDRRPWTGAAIGATHPAGDHSVEIRDLDSLHRRPAELDRSTERSLALVEHGHPLRGCRGPASARRSGSRAPPDRVCRRRRTVTHLDVLVGQADELGRPSRPRTPGSRVVPGSSPSPPRRAAARTSRRSHRSVRRSRGRCTPTGSRRSCPGSTRTSTTPLLSDARYQRGATSAQR